MDLVRHDRRSQGAVRKSNQMTGQAGNDKYNCLKCGKRHGKANCPAFGKTCALCNRPNHFAVGCKLRNKINVNSNNKYMAWPTTSNNNSSNVFKFKKHVHDVKTESDEDSPLYVDVITVNNINEHKNVGKAWTVDIKINNETVTFKLDTGCEL